MKMQKKTFFRSAFPLVFSICCALGFPRLTAFADTVYVANSGDNTVERFNAGGGFQFASTNADNPYGLAMDSAGNLYVVNSYGYNKIYRFAPGGSASLFAIATDPSPQGMAIDGAGNLYVANNNSSTIEKFSSTGVDLGVFAVTAGQPQELVFDTAGNLYVSEENAANLIQKFTPAGVGANFISVTSPPYGLAFDSSGNLFVSYPQANQIKKYSSSGADLGVFATNNLNYPVGLAFDSAGDLYAVNHLGNTVVKFTPDGISSVFANTGLNYPTDILIIQNTLSVDLKMFAGVILKSGQLGSNYLIQASPDLSGSNWTTLTNITLPALPYIYIDYNSYTNPKQFYRAVEP